MPDVVTHCFQDWMQSDAVKQIFAALDNNARFIGGAVRDALLGKEAKDIDISTPFTPEEVMERLNKIGIKTVPTGIKHGTITAFIAGSAFEITTLRRDTICFGRHAIVAFTDDWEEDAKRRDFTINAMSCTAAGEVFDYFGGVEDLKAKRLRFVGDAGMRCREDYLRILRFFRFFAYFGFEADINALMACKNMAGGISDISGERIQMEMFKLLAAPNPIFSLQLIVETNVADYVMPGVTISNIVFLERLLAAENTNAEDSLLKLAVLLGKNLDIADYIAKRWKLSNIDKNRLQFICDPANRLPFPLEDKNAKKLIRMWGKQYFFDMLLMALAYGLDKQVFNQIAALRHWNIADFPLTGQELLDIGHKPGKEMGKLLKNAESWWEENDYKPQKQELLEFVQRGTKG